MINKIVIIIMNLCCVLLVLNGMELQDLGDKNKEIVVQQMHLNLGPEILNRQNLTGSNSTSTARTPISGLNQVDVLLKTRSTLVQQKSERSMGSSTVRNRRLNAETNPDEVRVDISNVNGDTQNLQSNQMISHSTDIKGLEELFEEKNGSLSEREKWELLLKLNPRVYKFAQSHGKSFEDAMMYVELLEQCPIEPSFLVEFVKHANQLNKSNVTTEAQKHYEKMKDENLDKYTEIQLSTMEEVFDKEDGKEKPPTAHNEHLVVQEKKIKEQSGYLTKSMIVHGIHFLLTVGVAAWGTANEILAKTPHNGTGA